MIKILRAGLYGLDGLQSQINNLLEEGYVILGDVKMTQSTSQPIFIATLCKPEDKGTIKDD